MKDLDPGLQGDAVAHALRGNARLCIIQHDLFAIGSGQIHDPIRF